LIFRSNKKRNEKKLFFLRALSKIRVIEHKLAIMESGLSSSISSGLLRIAELKERGLNMDAELLAAELATRRQMLTEIAAMRANLERLRLRLETVMLVGESQESARQIKALMAEIKSGGFEKVPELSILLGELDEIVSEISSEVPLSGGDVSDAIPVVASPREVEKILKEAELIAERRERGKLPVPPGS